jgi:hypothetical protein
LSATEGRRIGEIEMMKAIRRYLELRYDARLTIAW